MHWRILTDQISPNLNYFFNWIKYEQTVDKTSKNKAPNDGKKTVKFEECNQGQTQSLWVTCGGQGSGDGGGQCDHMRLHSRHLCKAFL